ncbi:FAD-dependent pyridine nucleotide-disulphide oxidoreductase [Catenulispora acidiphila DSM 44928]|uniref:FAD-dependent pyridine nucleotide-disulphide oxidoreductase n=1 Tax=Catenulispora acidiphila (strain DSM 44928 / JCM 14897 / NBRC 102108 / NRRL B-24433 / ID139908) TaxID=479433 RepID=C7Q6V0_CATAD|nr:NAD(P)/FAD-dependent oxidoreductase [Catenulispora acidiphila]ACU75963.1 FAD-dependent pyridine nucleotide-disulphide oxidoreductase [Catenulispora acidiphila DSM 44928]
MPGTTTRTFDVIVIGAGPVGENVADRTTAAGLDTVIVEAERVGGECSYWACDPSKALLRPVLLHSELRGTPGLESAANQTLDAAAVLRHRNTMASEWDDAGQVEWLNKAGISLIRGHGRLAGPKEVTVTTPEGDVLLLTARHAVAVCTGTTAALPPLPGLEELRPWTSREATSAKEVPARLAILGAGVVATEMATAWQALGSQVTLIAREPGLLPRVEQFAADLVTERLRESGVDIRFDSGIAGAVRSPDSGDVHITLVDGSEVVVDELLLATGRAPRTDDLGMETVGLRAGDWLAVDDLFTVEEVDGEWLYAVGDVNRRALFTHQGKYQARIAGAVIAARAHRRPLDIRRWSRFVGTADRVAVPQVVFTDPEIAAVGLTTAEAERTGQVVDVVDYEIGQVAGAALHTVGYRGHARLLIDPRRRTVVGATFAGAGVAELLHSATIAITGEMPVERLWHAVPAFPTISEVWLRLLETYRDAI